MSAFKFDPKDAIGHRSEAEHFNGSAHQTAELGEPQVVQGWLEDMPSHSDRHVLVHRDWGTVVANTGDEGMVSVFWTDGKTTWYAVSPEAVEDEDLTPQEVERVVLDALTSLGPPQWPQWRVLI